MASYRESNLAKARKRAGLSQQELADRLKVSQSQISKWESDPVEYLPIKEAKRLGGILGCDWVWFYETEPNAADGQPADFGDPYKLMDANTRLLLDYVKAAPDQSALEDMDPPLAKNLRLAVRRFTRKPVIAVAGVFDTGKSTLLNTLMGRDVLPASYQPATRLATYVMHQDHRPSWMRDGETVLIVSDFDWDALYEQDSTKLRETAVIAIGNVQTLEEFGTHCGKYCDNEAARTALVFDDAPILRTCTFLDLPGYDESERDGKTADRAIGCADALVYASTAHPFMTSSDFQRLAPMLKNLPAFESHDPNFPTMDNVFLVVTQAHRGISDRELFHIADVAAGRFCRDQGEGMLALAERTGRKIDAEVIRSRIFTFYRELPERNAALFEALRGFCSEHMPSLWRKLADQTVEGFRAAGKRLRVRIEDWKETLRRFDEMRETLTEMEQQEPERKKSFGESRDRLLAKVSKYSQLMPTEFTSFLDKKLDVDVLTKEISARYKSRKEAKEFVSNYLVDKVQSKLERLCQKYGGLFSRDIEKELKDVLPSSLGTFEKPGALGIFDVKGTFIGAMAGLGTLGALGIWASTCGPLGGYILVAKGVGLLSALGIPMGSAGAAGVSSFVAAIGGPIVLALGLGLIAGLAFWKIFGDSWQRSLAKRLVKALGEKDARGMWLKIIEDFWAQTRAAIHSGYEALEQGCQHRLTEIRDIVNNPAESREKVEGQIELYERLSDFFGGLPWRRQT